jgi:hypothetical protein
MPLNASCSLTAYRKCGLFWSLQLPNVLIASGAAGGPAAIRGAGARGCGGSCGGVGTGADAMLGGVGQVMMGLACCGAVWPCPSGLGLSVGDWVSTGSGEGGRVGGRLGGRLEGRLEGRPDHSEASSLGVSVPSGVSGLGLGLRLGNAMVLAAPSGACLLLAIYLLLTMHGGIICFAMVLVLHVLGYLVCSAIVSYVPCGSDATVVTTWRGVLGPRAITHALKLGGYKVNLLMSSARACATCYYLVM